MRSTLLPVNLAICCLFYIGHALTANACIMIAESNVPCYETDMDGYAWCYSSAACLPFDGCPETSPSVGMYAWGGPCNGVPVCNEAATAISGENLNGSARNFWGYCEGWYMCGTYTSVDCWWNQNDYQDFCPFC
jgi:hypothetical protein